MYHKHNDINCIDIYKFLNSHSMEEYLSKYQYEMDRISNFKSSNPINGVPDKKHRA